MKLFLKLFLSLLGSVLILWVAATANLAMAGQKDTSFPPISLFALAVFGPQQEGGEAKNNQRHAFDVRLATTRTQQARGLMHVAKMDDNEAMLFVFAAPRIARFWMHDTLIPLDIIFIDPSGAITEIITRKDTQSDALSISRNKVRAVFEIKAGRAKELGIRVGDTIYHPLVEF